MTATPLIHLQGIRKVFLTDEVETHALSGVNFHIEKGEYVAIAGPSGCGKTTLLSILGLLDAPSDGEYTIAGQSVARLPPPPKSASSFRRSISLATSLLPKTWSSHSRIAAT